MIIHCLFGRHKRSKGQAREIGRTMYSVCESCGTELVQDVHRKWHRMTAQDRAIRQAALDEEA